MQVCKQCGVAAPPEQHDCVTCGVVLVSLTVAVAQPPSSSTIATPPAQHYLPAQPYVPPGQLYVATYLHPYVHEQAGYGELGALASSDEEPTVVAGEGDDASDAADVTPTDLVQRVYLRYLPQFATNPIAGALVGGAVAFLAVMVMTLAFLGVVGPLVGAALFAPLSSLPIMTTITFPPLATSGFFAIIGLEHHASFMVNTTAGMFTLTYPLTTLIVIPALCLTAGGYVAAATDYTRRWRGLLLRAAAIGPVYAMLLSLSSAFFGATPLHTAVAGMTGSATLGVDGSSLLLSGMLWGIMFGGLGGVVRLFGWRWRAALVALLLGRPRSSVLAGALGAVAAVGVGLMITFVMGIFIIATAGTSSQLLASLGHSDGWHNATPAYVLVLSAAASVWLFIFGIGGAFTTTIGSAKAVPISATVSVFDSHVPLAYLIVLVVPALVYFCGGYLAAHLTRSPSQKAHLIAGALVGVFGSVIILMLANVSGYSLSIAALVAIGTQNSTGPDPASAFLGSLIVGTICGVLGAFAFQPQASPRRPSRAHPLEPIFAWYDRLTLQPIGVSRSRARGLLYLAITAALAFAAFGIVLDIFGGVLARVVGVTALQTDVTLYGGLMLAVPTLLLLIAWCVDLMALPQGTEIVIQAALPPPSVAAAVPPSAPYEYPAHPPTLPAMPQIDQRSLVAAVAPHGHAGSTGSEGMAS